jgi:WhiB family transcriptional regulator, redox-sensing transcriptional regulator
MSRKIYLEDAASRYNVTERTILRWVLDYEVTKYVNPLDQTDVMYDDDELCKIARPQPSIQYKDIDWQSANCRGIQTDLFFLEEDLVKKKHLEYEMVRRVCFSCPIRKQCLEWAYATSERYGMMGGVTGVERRLIAKGEFKSPFLGSLNDFVKKYGIDFNLLVEASKVRRIIREVPNSGSRVGI